MTKLTDQQADAHHVLMGNEAIARGALEAGVKVVTGYPGTPSSEIIESLAKVAGQSNIYVEWSTNEKVAMEVAAAASFARLRSLCAMKQNGVNVASDFMLHLAGSGTRGGMVLITCDDPGALSSANEGESRHFAKMFELPLLEPGDFQEAKDMTRWAFELSETIRNMVVVRSVTRMSHASGNVSFGKMLESHKAAEFEFEGPVLDPLTGQVTSVPVGYKHQEQQNKLIAAMQIFEESPFNTYSGPDKPELLIITSSACSLYSREAIALLDVEDRVGLLKLGTTWPLPPKLLKRHLMMTDDIMIVEEVLPFIEDNIKIMAAEQVREIGIKNFYGKNEGYFPTVGEMNPDLVMSALNRIFSTDYRAMSTRYAQKIQQTEEMVLPERERAFCPGCPHRASFWSIHNALKRDNRKGFVCGDIGCYAMGRFASGFNVSKTLHAMGSGAGIAGGFGKLEQFGLDQPALAVCGDSTFFHAVLPALVNAVHHQSNLTLIVLDNSGTAMTGFQSHPGLEIDAMGEKAPAVDIAKVCEGIGANVEAGDPFDLEKTRLTLNQLLENQVGVNVLILQQACALSPDKRYQKTYDLRIDETRCLGEECGCNRLCTRIFRCPGLIWDEKKEKAQIDDVLCAGCGVCETICPNEAIGAHLRKE